MGSDLSERCFLNTVLFRQLRLKLNWHGPVFKGEMQVSHDSVRGQTPKPSGGRRQGASLQRQARARAWRASCASRRSRCRTIARWGSVRHARCPHALAAGLRSRQAVALGHQACGARARVRACVRACAAPRLLTPRLPPFRALPFPRGPAPLLPGAASAAKCHSPGPACCAPGPRGRKTAARVGPEPVDERGARGQRGGAAVRSQAGIHACDDGRASSARRVLARKVLHHRSAWAGRRRGGRGRGGGGGGRGGSGKGAGVCRGGAGGRGVW